MWRQDWDYDHAYTHGFMQKFTNILDDGKDGQAICVEVYLQFYVTECKGISLFNY